MVGGRGNCDLVGIWDATYARSKARESMGILGLLGITMVGGRGNCDSLGYV